MSRIISIFWLLVFAAGCAGPSDEELQLIARELDLRDGAVVADVGAGDGALVPYLSAAVGDSGTVLATEIDPDAIESLNDLISTADLTNVRVVPSTVSASGLSPTCCDAIVLRRVYHHLSDPTAFLRDLATALNEQGRLLIIDFHPAWALSASTPEELPENRDGHGVLPSQLIDEATRNGFVLEAEIPDWPGSGGGLMEHFAVRFSVARH